MDSNDLLTFETVARAGGITRAARELHTVQSNVTARVRALERELGTELFHRHPRGVSLTGAGERLLPYARQVASLLADARRAALDDGVPRGSLTIGSLETTAALRLPPILAAYAAACPEVDIRLRTGTTAELVEEVVARRLEGALVAGPVSRPELCAVPVVEEELVVVTAPGVAGLDETVRGGRVKVVIFRAGCSYRERFERILAAAGVRPSWIEFGTLDGIIGCVGAGIGVSLLPRSVVEPARRRGAVALHPLSAHEARVTTVFVRRRDAYLSGALRRFLDHLRPPPPADFAAASP